MSELHIVVKFDYSYEGQVFYGLMSIIGEMAIIYKVVILDVRRRLDVLNGQDGQTDMSICPLSVGIY
jgi:hypothetical protein